MNWSERWPSWASEWWGVLIRVLVAGLGVLTGMGAGILATFSATFKKTPPEWNLENVSLLVLGVVIAVASLWLAIRPSRLAVTALGSAIVGGIVVGWVV